MNLQQTIIEGIREQLFYHDYLVLPRFGGFVLKPRPAHFSPSGGQLMPPAKSVSFNAQLKQNDGILALWLAQRLNCSAAEALEHLHDFSEYCNGILQAKRRLDIQGIGFFYLDFENNTSFEPRQDANFLRDSFGLSPVNIKPIVPEKTQVIPGESTFAPRLQPAGDRLVPHRRLKARVSTMALPLAVTLLFILMIFLVLPGNRLVGELKSSLFGSTGMRQYQPLDYAALELKTTSGEPVAYVADAGGVARLELARGRFVSVRAVAEGDRYEGAHGGTLSESGGYEVVLGCFTVLNNAHRLLNKLSAEKLEARISGKNSKGMYVVSKGSFQTREAALKALGQVKARVPGAWIKKSGN